VIAGAMSGVATAIETVVDRLQRLAVEQPHAPAILSPGRTLVYRELHARTAGCAAWLRTLGIERGERVGVTIADEELHLVVALALASLGAAHATLASHDGPAARSRFAARIGARRVLVAREEHRLADLESAVIDPERAASWTSVPREPLSGPDPASLLTFFTTSGTTGEAKIIPVRHGDFVLQTARSRVGRVLSLASIEHALAKRQFLYAVIRGTSVAIPGSADLPVARLCAQLGVDIIASNAARARAVLGEAPVHGRLPPGTELTAAGAHTSAAFRRRLLDGVCDAVQITYSLQECGSVARTIERDPDRTTDTVGRLHPEVEIAIVDASGAPLPPGEAGEIRIRAPGMASGYLDDDAANARHFRDGWFQPGDLASFTVDGALVVHGRADDVMILNGIKIAPIEIERALERHPEVRAVVAFPLRSPVHGELPVAAVELVDGGRATGRDLQAFARQALGMRAPRRVIVVARLPITEGGKVDLRDLVRRAGAGGIGSGD